MTHFTDIQGPVVCPLPCGECADLKHHWLTVCFPGCLTKEDDDYYEELLSDPVQTLIREEPGEQDLMWLQCKHCDAWHRITDEMLDDDEFEFI